MRASWRSVYPTLRSCPECSPCRATRWRAPPWTMSAPRRRSAGGPPAAPNQGTAVGRSDRRRRASCSPTSTWLAKHCSRAPKWCSSPRSPPSPRGFARPSPSSTSTTTASNHGAATSSVSSSSRTTSARSVTSIRGPGQDARASSNASRRPSPRWPAARGHRPAGGPRGPSTTASAGPPQIVAHETCIHRVFGRVHITMPRVPTGSRTIGLRSAPTRSRKPGSPSLGRTVAAATAPSSPSRTRDADASAPRSRPHGTCALSHGSDVRELGARAGIEGLSRTWACRRRTGRARRSRGRSRRHRGARARSGR